MTRDELTTLLGYRLNRTDMTAKMLLEMDFVQSFKLEGTGAFLPWFLESEMAATTLEIGEERIELPSDFLGEIEGQHLWLYNPDNADFPYKELHKSDYDKLMQKYPAVGTPTEYTISGNYILVKPTPDNMYAIKMRYYAKDILPSLNNVENKWMKYAADLFIAELGVLMAGVHMRNMDLAVSFANDATIARDRLWKKNEARQHVNRIYGMGED